MSYTLVLVYLNGVEGTLSVQAILILFVGLHLIIDMTDFGFKNITKSYVTRDGDRRIKYRQKTTIYCLFFAFCVVEFDQSVNKLNR